MMAVAVVGPFLILLAVTAVSGETLPKHVKVCVGEGVRIRALNIAGSLKRCDVITPSGSYITLLPTKNNIRKENGVAPVYWDSGIEGERCGFLLSEVSKEDVGKWTLSVESSMNSTNETATVSTIDCDQNFDRQSEFFPGQNFLIEKCGSDDSIRCSLHEPKRVDGMEEGEPPPGEDKTCSLKGTFDSHDTGVWTCDWATENSLKIRTSKMTIKQKSPMSVGIKESSEEVAMWCSPNVPSIVLQTCRWVNPGGEDYYPREGLVLGRYAYYGKGLRNNECGISIRKPLEDGDKGVWRCEMYQPAGDRPSYGAFVELGIPPRTRDQKVSTLRKWAGAWKKGEHELAVGVAGQNLTLGCSLQSSLSFCQFIHPNGSTIEPMEGSNATPYGNGHYMGDCGITITNPSPEDTGIWKCIVGVEYGDAAVTLIEVRVYESEMASVNFISGLSSGTTLHCESVFGVALEHCRFQRPDGSMFIVAQKGSPNVEKMLSETGIQAMGNLSEGICSVTLSTVRSSDVGVWRCIGRIAGQKKEVWAKFTLRTKSLTGASAGAITGITVAVFALVGIGAAVWIRKRKKRNAGLLEGISRGGQQQSTSVTFRRSSDED